MSDDDTRREGDYRAARIGSAAVLFLTVAFIMLADAFIPYYDANPVTIGILVTVASSLLGVEIVGLLKK